MDSLPTLLVYRNTLLNLSETFIKLQMESLKQFTPYYVGLRAKNDISWATDRHLVLSEGGICGKIKERNAALHGFPSQFVHQIRRIQPKLIHSHFGQDGAVALPLALRLNLPLIVTYHGFDITTNDESAASNFIQKIYIQRRKTLARSARLFIAVSNFIYREMVNKGFPEEKLVVHHIGVDVDHFSFKPLVGRENIILFVGRLVEKKGCEHLIDAMGQLQTSFPELKLVVIGDGPLRPQLIKRAASKVRHYSFLGAQPHHAVKAWMQRAKVFCVPSLTARSGDTEGFGQVFAEAQAVGLPVVSFASGGVPEAVAHAETGLLATEGNIEELTAHLIRLLSDVDLWQYFSHQGRERVCKLFDLKRQSERLEQIYMSQAMERFDSRLSISI
ncbi:glycosyltransferase [Acaryochloris sp. IP29b_bin.148]|uniref:glycosyltransferase n=1 Tax=Acaryochloris sp. IP29b_bin.148 TaxID=2969218 RepID=UPI00260282C0|nr:glycosyltransferase [Acaryochloris sp. IP29b_bin.148]